MSTSPFFITSNLFGLFLINRKKLLDLYIQEIFWILKNSSESSEFRKRPFELGWLTIPRINPKLKSKDKIQKNVVHIQKMQLKHCENYDYFFQQVGDLIDLLRSKLTKKSQSRDESEGYKIRRNNDKSNKIDPFSKGFRRLVVDRLKSLFSKNQQDSGNRNFKIKGNLYYVEVLSTKHLSQNLDEMSIY